MLTDNRDLQGRPWYYQHVFADPVAPDTVWVLNYSLWRSIDGGKTFEEVSAPHGDHHDLWIDPRDPLRMIEGADGGACVSFNGGDTWSTLYNQLTAQFYRLDTDNRFPYNIYATQQDNTAIMAPSAADDIAINWADCRSVGSSESGHIAAHPENPDVVFSGRYRQRAWRRRSPSTARPQYRPDPHRHRVARRLLRCRREGHEAPLPVDLSDPVFAA